MVPLEQEAPDFRNVAGQAVPGLSSVWPNDHMIMPRSVTTSSGDAGGGGVWKGAPTGQDPLPRPLHVMVPG